MSECVVRMKKPKSCDDCDIAQRIGNVIYCPFLGWYADYDKCPVFLQLPEGHGRLVDVTKIDFVMFTNEDSTFRCGWNNGVRSVMQHAETIVPAERIEEK